MFDYSEADFMNQIEIVPVKKMKMIDEAISDEDMDMFKPREVSEKVKVGILV